MTDKQPCLLAIDIGTTHCKVGLFTLDGACLQVASQPTPASSSAAGVQFIPPGDLWSVVARAVAGLQCESRSLAVAGIGIASTAESGLLVDRADGSPRTDIIPWFDTSASSQVARIAKEGSARDRFLASGTYLSFKCSLAKILWAQQHLEVNLEDALWLSVADAIAFRLTGSFQTDYSLAGRTYAFRIFEKEWDASWLKQFGLSSSLFPPARPAFQPAGRLPGAVAAGLNLPAGIPVCIAGHDHICASLAVGAIHPGVVLDSLGTAEALVGAFPEKALVSKDYQSGFSIGCHVAPRHFYWIGGLSTSGGAVEWLRKLVSEEGLSYADLGAILDKITQIPGDILFFPYLAGAGSPHSNPDMRAAFLGLRLDHQLGDLVKAVLEGTAYEVELMRRQGEKLMGGPIDHLVASGGGVNNTRWMQIKADVTGCRYELAQSSEAVLSGAALVAGMGAGLYGNIEEALKAIARPAETIYQPDPERHARYQAIYERQFLNLQKPLQEFSK